MKLDYSDFGTIIKPLYKLHFWRWGITLDWGRHRWIFTIRSNESDYEADS